MPLNGIKFCYVFLLDCFQGEDNAGVVAETRDVCGTWFPFTFLGGLTLRIKSI